MIKHHSIITELPYTMSVTSNELKTDYIGEVENIVDKKIRSTPDKILKSYDLYLREINEHIGKARKVSVMARTGQGIYKQ